MTWLWKPTCGASNAADGPGTIRADAEGIRALHHAHLLTVPFENPSIHLGAEISLDESRLLDKIVTRRRGGFCYELNGAFALLPEALGARVERLSAKVNGAAGLSPPSTTSPWPSIPSTTAARGSPTLVSAITPRSRCASMSEVSKLIRAACFG